MPRAHRWPQEEHDRERLDLQVRLRHRTHSPTESPQAGSPLGPGRHSPAVGGSSAIPLHPPLPIVGVSIRMKTGVSAK